MPIMTMGLDNRFPATPWTVWPAVLAIEPIVLPAVLATEPIELVTVPTSCPGIAIILLASQPMVPMIWLGIPRIESRNIKRLKYLSVYFFLYIMKLKKKEEIGLRLSI